MLAANRPLRTRRTQNTIEQFDELPDCALIGIHAVAALLGRSAASIRRDVLNSRFAKPVHIGMRSTRWNVGDVRNYLKVLHHAG